jgi:adenine phosphoribosyltransferase
MSSAPAESTPSTSALNPPGASTSAHPPSSSPDPTLTSNNAAQGGFSATAAAGSAELAHLKVRLREALRQFPDFPSPGILFEDILPIFVDPSLHEALLRALELQILRQYGESTKPDVVVGLEARGFLFGPSLALRLGAAFVPVRKQGKLPGPTETASYKKEYGEDFFQMQKDAIKPGQKVLVVDDIIATGRSNEIFPSITPC